MSFFFQVFLNSIMTIFQYFLSYILKFVFSALFIARGGSFRYQVFNRHDTQREESN